jgi:hypothetical protein
MSLLLLASDDAVVIPPIPPSPAPTLASVEWDEATRLAFARVLTLWVDGLGAPLTPINLDDETMAEPEGVPWIRVSTRETASRIRAMTDAGAHRFAREANVWIQVFAPPDGADVANKLAKRARLMFEGVRINAAMVFDAARIITLGFDGAKWYAVTVQAPFRYYETH